VIGCFYLRLQFENHCSQYATYYSCKYKPILFPICCFLLTRIHNSPKLSSTYWCFFWGEIFCTHGDHKNKGVNCTMSLFGNIFIFCKICKIFKETQSEVVTLRCWGHGDHQNKVGFSQSFTTSYLQCTM